MSRRFFEHVQAGGVDASPGRRYNHQYTGNANMFPMNRLMIQMMRISCEWRSLVAAWTMYTPVSTKHNTMVRQCSGKMS